MILRPCLRCHQREGCVRRDEMRAKLRGTGVTTASFKCPERLRGLEPGRRVDVTIHGAEIGQRYDGDRIIGIAIQRGTVVCPSHKSPWKIVVRLDVTCDPDHERLYVKVWPDNCAPLDEVRALCAMDGCGHPVDERGTCHKLAEHIDDAHQDALNLEFPF
jgi:hypothetical protein